MRRIPLLFTALFSALLFAAANSARAQGNAPTPVAPDIVRIYGDMVTSGTLATDQLEKMQPVDFAWTSHEQTHKYRGVRVDKVLEKFGYSIGPEGATVPVTEKRNGFRCALLAIGKDGYKAAFSCAEIWEKMGSSRLYLVWQMDGAPIGADNGPLRLICDTDKEGARSVHNLTELRVIDLGKISSSAAGAASKQ